MKKQMAKTRGTKKKLLVYLLILVLTMSISITAMADTDGTEPQITQQPDQLVLQLGARWAGVEFELRTDAGVFPVPIIVDSSGVLRMDLGGSTAYILSCVDSAVPIPNPSSAATETTAPDQTVASPEAEQQPAVSRTVPTGHVVIFLIGLAAAIGILIALRCVKNRRRAVYDDWSDEEYDP